MGILSKIKNLFAKKDEKEVKSYEQALSKTRNEFVNKLNILGIKYSKVTPEFYEELEELLIGSDIGVNTVIKLIDQIKKRVKEENITDFSFLKEVIVDELFLIYVGNDILSNQINYNKEDITVILFIGVNGVGKTTSIAKLANKLKNSGKKVLLIAGDTFRAGAIEQLKEWANNVGVDFYSGKETDPASVVFDGLKYAKENNNDVVLIDTAGRLQNKLNLMKELEKINKVISSFVPDAPQETLLVIDASTGQNGISQAKSFKDITNVTGIILTKLDGTARGGIVIAIKDETNIPVKYVGLGEKVNDFVDFDIEKYVYGLFKEF